MHYFELTTTAYLLKNIAFNEVNEKIAQLINKAMLNDECLTIKHEENKFKNYVFDSKNGERIYLQDEMGESPMAFAVAAKLLKIAYKRKQEELRQFESSFESLNIVGITKGFVNIHYYRITLKIICINY